MALSFTKYQPRKGQFVALWEYEGKPWSSIFKFEDSRWYVYNNHEDLWELITHPIAYIPTHEDITDVKYAVIR